MSDAIAAGEARHSMHPAEGSLETGATEKQVGRLTVNAAFLQEIKEDNRQLKALWDQVAPMLDHIETARNHWTDLETSFAELRDQLAMHFSLEEAYGYFDDAVDIAPHLSLKAESLRGQHSRLFAQIRDLAEMILESNPERESQVTRLIRRFRAFQIEFERHEESELKLILQSFDDDLGVGD